MAFGFCAHPWWNCLRTEVRIARILFATDADTCCGCLWRFAEQRFFTDG